MKTAIITSIEEQSRASTDCICGKKKEIGNLVCCKCFKDRTDIPPLKDYQGTFQQWSEMAQNAPAQPETATMPCKCCGNMITYECIWVFGHDLGRSLNLHCDDCQTRIDEEAEQAKRQRRLEERQARVSAMLPPDLLETDIQHPEFNRPLWRAVQAWRPTQDAFWLGLIGPAGRCKTRCLAMAARESILRGNRVVWTTANRLLEASHDRSHKDRQTATLAREHLADCLHAGVLVLDDLGKNEWTNAFESQFFQILDHRKNHRLPILFSSNAHPEQFSLVLSDLNREPIIGRLKDRTTLLEIKR